MRQRKKYNIVTLDETPVKVERGRKVFTPAEQKSRMARLLMRVGIAAGIVILAVVVSLTVISQVGNSRKQVPEEKKKTTDEQVVYTDNDSISVLIALTDDGKKSAEHFLLMRIDPMCLTMENYGYGVCFMSLPPELSVLDSGETMAKEFSVGGTAQCAADLQGVCDSKKIYTATINYKSLYKLIDSIGGVIMTIEHDLNYISPNGDKNIYISAGHRSCTGSEAARVMYCPDWPGGVDEQRLVISRAFAEMANKLLCRNNSAYLDSYFKKITNAVTTDVSAGKYQEIKKSLHQFALDNDGSEDITKIFLCQTEEIDGVLRFSEKGEQAMKTLFGAHG